MRFEICARPSVLPAQHSIRPVPGPAHFGVRLAKPGVYALNAEGRPADAADTQQAAQWGGRAVLATAACASLAIFFAAIPRA
jgi:cobalamin biosynthesis protein CobD/CbiB